MLFIIWFSTAYPADTWLVISVSTGFWLCMSLISRASIILNRKFNKDIFAEKEAQQTILKKYQKEVDELKNQLMQADQDNWQEIKNAFLAE